MLTNSILFYIFIKILIKYLLLNSNLIFINCFQFILDEVENLQVDPEFVDENNVLSKFYC